MSADFINGLGARSPQLRESYGAGARPPVGGAESAPQTGETASNTQAPSRVEGFSPTSEAGETNQDRQAGEARASQIFSAWGPSQAGPSASAGTLDVQGAENTSVSHQVHSVQNGQHVGNSEAASGFTEATTYSSRPPV